MCKLDAFTENLFSFANMIGGNGQVLELLSGSLAAATGLPYAGENYAIFTPRATVDELSKVLDFFKEKELPFVVPQLYDFSPSFSASLDSAGLSVRRRYTAMSLNPAVAGEWERDNDIVSVSDEMVSDWASTVWEGFGGDISVPDEYCLFADYLNRQRDNRLFLLMTEDRPASAALLHSSASACGLYYFATLPAFRRRGLARRHMKELVQQARQFSDEFVLLATEEGLPFYIDFGFTALADVPMRSISDDL
ncbi:MAG: GNAT family N-acetyltransferase [Synergistaceae bacterium]|nr:GNAT family N-acetyltransferase [Synergistaceae bacterium]